MLDERSGGESVEDGLMPRTGRQPQPRPPAVVAALGAHGLRERLERAEAELDAVRAERDAAVRIAYRDGLPQAEIARVLGVSSQLVSLILRDSR